MGIDLRLAVAAAAACAPELPPLPEGAGVIAAEVSPPPPSLEGAVVYTLRSSAPWTHYLEVEAWYPNPGGGEVELAMAVWTPGSYLVREYSRHVEGVEAFAEGGAALPVEKVAKNRWAVDASGAERLRARYRVYAREMSVRTNFVDAEMALINGAPTFMSTDATRDRPHVVRLELPAGWSHATGLPAGEGEGVFVAADYDALVDGPIVAGDLTTYTFEAGGAAHRLVNLMEPETWDGARAAADVEAIARAQIAFWGGAPFSDYTFLNLIVGGGGGLEHANSTVTLAGPWRTGDPESYRGWLGLMSHEYFHTWNVKRLRPAALGPFDYEREVYTDGLWVAEGVTSYYDDLILVRAGLMTEAQYLGALSDTIAGVQEGAGREVRTLAQASFDAWIKHYRPDENSRNVSVNYYRKGALAGWLLDAHIRRATGDRRALDDLMRAAYARYSGASGYAAGDLRALAAEVAGRDLSAFFDAVIDGTDELDYRPALTWWGLRFVAPDAGDPEGREEDAPTPGWLGAEATSRGGRLVVDRVPRGTPAMAAGLNVGDEIVAIDGWRVGDPGAVGRWRPGDEVDLTIARRDRLRRLPVTLGEAPEAAWVIEIDPDATPAAARRRAAWLEIE